MQWTQWKSNNLVNYLLTTKKLNAPIEIMMNMTSEKLFSKTVNVKAQWKPSLPLLSVTQLQSNCTEKSEKRLCFKQAFSFRSLVSHIISDPSVVLLTCPMRNNHYVCTIYAIIINVITTVCVAVGILTFVVTCTKHLIIIAF